MTVREELHNEAMHHLRSAKQIIENLMSISPDWTATTMLEIDFKNLEKSCHDFGLYQLGISPKVAE